MGYGDGDERKQKQGAGSESRTAERIEKPGVHGWLPI
jgi:hypothetical protein